MRIKLFHAVATGTLSFAGASVGLGQQPVGVTSNQLLHNFSGACNAR
jgi:hypothetical protein